MASNGYILIRVGIGHHLADVRGYAYEHRLSAEAKLGRRLLPGEIVHHKDENKTNNDPNNLEIVTRQTHLVEHRRPGAPPLRMPGEANRLVRCKCGCGNTFQKYDGVGRPRSYVSGHNRKGHHGRQDQNRME